MKEVPEVEQLLKVLVHVVGRSVVPMEKLEQIVAPTRGSEKQIRAFNLCDGSRTQAEIVKVLSLDPGNFSKTLARWESAGIVYRLKVGSDQRLLHLYPLPERKPPRPASTNAKGEDRHER
jgi:DNA-binding MarR family transcriptional regulator